MLRQRTIALFLAFLVSARVTEAADTALSANLKGTGVFLQGAGSYNLNTAKAAAIYSNIIMQWKKERYVQWHSLHAQRESAQKQQAEEARYKQALQEYQLRVDPKPEDIASGRALNALINDLMDPDIPTDYWATRTVHLPAGMSVKDLIFRFLPRSGPSNASMRLSRAVIALSRLEVKGKRWPICMNDKSLNEERAAYEEAYANLQQEVLADEFDGRGALDRLDQSLDGLEKKVNALPKDKHGYRDAAANFVRELKEAALMYDAVAIDYAKEILADTKDQDATTVAELVSFMLKYRLRFESAEGTSAGVLYRQIYERMREQAQEFELKTPEMPVALGQFAGPAAADPGTRFTVNSVWTTSGVTLTVTERKGDTFSGIFTAGQPRIKRIVKGVITGDQVSWLAKDTRALKGNVGHDNFGTIKIDGGGWKIDFTFRGGKDRKSGAYTLRLK